MLDSWKRKTVAPKNGYTVMTHEIMRIFQDKIELWQGNLTDLTWAGCMNRKLIIILTPQ